jgi:hypothetical protein
MGKKSQILKQLTIFYDEMGQQGWEIRPLGMGQGVYTYFVVMQREVS